MSLWPALTLRLFASLAVAGAPALYGVATTPGSPSASGQERQSNAPVGSPDARQLRLLLEEAAASRGPHLQQRVQAFYAARGFEPAWVSSGRREAAAMLLGRLRAAEDDGLRPGDYLGDVWGVPSRDGATTGREGLLRDVSLTSAFLRYADDLAHGAAHLDAHVRQMDVAGVLAGARDAQAARAALARLEPRHAEYRQLRRALATYRDMAAAGGWPAVPEGARLTPEGAADEDLASGRAAAAVCRRLAVTGDLEPGGTCETAAGQPYDALLVRAVRTFQARHGLVVDGIVGPRTLAALNVPIEDQITRLAVNLNRWRRLPDDLGDVHVHVNVAGFRLDVSDRGRTALSMGVVVGTPQNPTPRMSDAIGYLEFRPYWNVPDSITRSELLPRILEDPEYLRKKRFDVLSGWARTAIVVEPSTIDWTAVAGDFPYRLRQRPGRQNSLGLVKFMFPNRHHVYLHDTPAKHLFAPARRAFSHGCVRVDDPVGLASFLLRGDPAWPREAIAAAMDAGPRQVVPLAEAVPVHLTYLTAWVNEDTVQFRPDLYGLDREEKRAMESSAGGG